MNRVNEKIRGLFIGLTTVDIQYFVDSFPESNTKVKTKPPQIITGGPATNAAVAFSYLGGEPLLASATGENPFKSFIKNDFKSTGLKHIDLIEGQEKNPVLATVVTSEQNGDRTIFTHHPEKIIPEINVKNLITNVKSEVLLLDGFYPEVAVDAAQVAKKLNIPVVLDCGSWKPQYEKLISYADLVICSEDFHPPACKTVNDVFTFLNERNINQAAVSRGANSILFIDDEKTGEIQINSTNVIDTLGAGDFLHGAFCYYYLIGKNFEKALENASRFASKTCEYPGTRSWLNQKI